jgi:hypothetical protein
MSKPVLKPKSRHWRLWATAGLAGAGLLTAGALQAAQPAIPPVGPNAPAYLGNFPDFAVNPTSQMPGDVDTDFQAALEKVQEFPLVQREFDLYSWQMFFAVNWPTTDAGVAAPTLTATGPDLAPHWTLWNKSPDVYRADGGTPVACATGAPKPMMLKMPKKPAPPPKPLAVSRTLTPFAEQATANPRTTRFLGVISAVGEVTVNTDLGDIQQAFTGPLIDQNGEFVYYEIMIDPNETGYLCQNSLYNINGQVAFSAAGGKVVMPSGLDTTDWSGSFELKIAWKVLKPGVDDPTRFFTQDAYIKDEDANNKEITRKVKVGLVGLHIGHKTKSSPQWIWSTFEQIDNLDVDPVAHPNLNPNFTNPGCPICTPNVLPIAINGVYPRTPVQAWRSIPIPGDKVALNAQVRAAMASIGSVWQYYQLIDTQWPTGPSTPPSPWNGGLPNSVVNKPGGNATPVFLTNITMETYFQGPTAAACTKQEIPGSANYTCPPSPFQPVWSSTQNNGGKPTPQPPNGDPGGAAQIFASESCMGCHSSAGIYTSYNPQTQSGTQSGQLTADFSWLMAQKASWKSN